MDGLTGFSANRLVAESSFWNLNKVTRVSKTLNQKCEGIQHSFNLSNWETDHRAEGKDETVGWEKTGIKEKIKLLYNRNVAVMWNME